MAASPNGRWNYTIKTSTLCTEPDQYTMMQTNCLNFLLLHSLSHKGIACLTSFAALIFPILSLPLFNLACFICLPSPISKMACSKNRLAHPGSLTSNCLLLIKPSWKAALRWVTSRAQNHLWLSSWCYWEGFVDTSQQTLKSFIVCRSYSGSNLWFKYDVSSPELPFQAASINMVVSLPTANSVHHYILIAVDHMTKCDEASSAAISTATAKILPISCLIPLLLSRQPFNAVIW